MQPEEGQTRTKISKRTTTSWFHFNFFKELIQKT